MRNRLLASLDARDRDLLHPHLADVALTLRMVLQQPGPASEFVYFVEGGLLSLVTAAGRHKIEIGIIGLEGFAGIPAVLGADESLHQVIVQIAGSARRIRVAELRRCMAASPTLSALLLKFVHVSLAQISHTALANGRNTVEQRLARWLLMADDRLEGAEIGLTHEFLAVMLGVRRPGVTVALHMLEGEHAIRSRRNSIKVTDREKLKAVAGPSYGGPEALYESLLGRVVSAAA